MPVCRLTAVCSVHENKNVIQFTANNIVSMRLHSILLLRLESIKIWRIFHFCSFLGNTAGMNFSITRNGDFFFSPLINWQSKELGNLHSMRQGSKAPTQLPYFFFPGIRSFDAVGCSRATAHWHSFELRISLRCTRIVPNSDMMRTFVWMSTKLTMEEIHAERRKLFMLYFSLVT